MRVVSIIATDGRNPVAHAVADVQLGTAAEEVLVARRQVLVETVDVPPLELHHVDVDQGDVGTPVLTVS